jgi:hypothetical protein
MGPEHIADIVRSVRQQALDHAAAGVRIEYAVALNGQFSGFIEGRLIVGGILAGRLHRLVNLPFLP